MLIDRENSKISNFLKPPVKRGVGVDESWRSHILLQGAFQALYINKIELINGLMHVPTMFSLKQSACSGHYL
jgi:hypothetical protein